MLKIVCDICGGEGKEFAYDSFGVVCAARQCLKCNGKGYTEHEGILEDLELAAATKAAFKSGGCFLKADEKEIALDQLQLINWHRSQKGGKE